MMRNKLPAIRPGEFLAEILGEIGVSQAAFERAVGVSAMRVSHVVTGARPITADLALRLARRSVSRRNIGSTCRRPMILRRRAMCSAASSPACISCHRLREGESGLVILYLTATQIRTAILAKRNTP